MPGRNVVPEMEETTAGKTEAALKELVEAVRENTKEMARERKGHERGQGGGPRGTGQAPSGTGDIENALALASSLHGAAHGPAKSSSTLDAVHTIIEGAKIAALFIK
jgi:hypothetical protein